MNKLLKTTTILSLTSLLISCSSVEKSKSPEEIIMAKVIEDKETLFGEDEKFIFNPHIYRANIFVDRYALEPALTTYNYYMPNFVQDRFKYFFRNIGEVPTFANLVLQTKLFPSVETLGRFLINTTVGILGTFDVATDMGLSGHKEGLGNTLAYYGVSEGLPLVLPFYGPSNLRNTLGLTLTTLGMNELELPLPISIGSGLQTKKDIKLYFGGTDYVFEYEYLKYINKKIGEYNYLKSKTR